MSAELIRSATHSMGNFGDCLPCPAHPEEPTELIRWEIHSAGVVPNSVHRIYRCCVCSQTYVTLEIRQRDVKSFAKAVLKHGGVE